MSLLEDIFLQDEADEAQELERVIEGDEYDERSRSRSGSPDSDENVNRDDEAEEDKRRVDPSSTKTKRVVKNPRFILNPARLTGPRGIQIIPDHFKDFRFKGKGHEKDDLDMVLKKLEHWAFRLYPKFQFEDCLKKIETLGKKRPVMVHLHKIRTDQFLSEDTVVQKDSSDEETSAAPQEEDEFDKLLQQQIDKARATPAPGSVKKVMDTPKQDRSPFTMPKATSSPSISDEQKERMIRNRKLAEERRLARLKQSSMDISTKQGSGNISDIIEVDEEPNVAAKKHNRSKVDSSDDDCDVTFVNQAITVDVHSSRYIDEKVNKNTDSINGNVVLETGRNTLEDVNMDQSRAKNNAVDAGQDVVEVIDLVHKDVDRNIDTNKAFECDNVITIIDHDDRSIKKRFEKNYVALDVIEISDDGINKNNNNESEIHKDVEINDHADKVMDNIKVVDNKDKENCVIISESNDTKENYSNLKDDLTNDDSPKTFDAVSISGDVTNSTEMNYDSESKGYSRNNKDGCSMKQTDNNIEEKEIEDVMDVDFSDDF